MSSIGHRSGHFCRHVSLCCLVPVQTAAVQGAHLLIPRLSLPSPYLNLHPDLEPLLAYPPGKPPSSRVRRVPPRSGEGYAPEVGASPRVQMELLAVCRRSANGIGSGFRVNGSTPGGGRGGGGGSGKGGVERCPGRRVEWKGMPGHPSEDTGIVMCAYVLDGFSYPILTIRACRIEDARITAVSGSGDPSPPRHRPFAGSLLLCRTI